MTQYKVILVPAHSAIPRVYLSQIDDVLGGKISNASGLLLYGGPIAFGVRPFPLFILKVCLLELGTVKQERLRIEEATGEPR